MEQYIVERLAEVGKLLNIINEKLELIQKSIILNIKITGKLHGVDLSISSDDIEDSTLN